MAFAVWMACLSQPRFYTGLGGKGFAWQYLWGDVLHLFFARWLCASTYVLTRPTAYDSNMWSKELSDKNGVIPSSGKGGISSGRIPEQV